MSLRIATHASSWYTGDRRRLSYELDQWLDAVTAETSGCEDLPIPGARVIMAPHAGYAYSGSTAAFAYKAWDLSTARRIIILGPAHHVYINGCAVSGCVHYDTPLGQLTLDVEYIKELKTTGRYPVMSTKTDQDEHSIEMQLPYIYKMIERAGKRHEDVKIVPILVGSISAAQEKDFGKTLKKAFQDPENAVVVSTDFCHWGSRFSYTHYFKELPTYENPNPVLLETGPPGDTAPDPPIHASIKALDQQGMAAIGTGRHDQFTRYINNTKNTICGRHPIGVVMAGVEAALGGVPMADEGKFKFLKYSQSESVNDLRASSVSYVSGFMLL